MPLVLFSNPAVPARTLAEFIAYAKANPGKVNYGVPGLGTVNHLMMERLKQTTGTEITCIPYRGSPPAVLALMKNEIQVFPIGLAAVGTSLREGKLTALAVATRERVPMLPDVPTIAEFGLPGFCGLELVRIGRAGRHARSGAGSAGGGGGAGAKTALVKERFAKLSMLLPQLSRAQFAASLKAEAAFWRETVQRGQNHHRVGSPGLPPAAAPAISARSGPPSISSRPLERAGSAIKALSSLEEQPVRASLVRLVVQGPGQSFVPIVWHWPHPPA